MHDWVDLARRYVPPWIRRGLQRVVGLQGVKRRYRERQNPLARVLAGDENRSGSPIRFGIVRNSAQYHKHFVQACIEESVPFRVLDLYREDWLQKVRDAGCQVLLVWPDATRTDLAAMVKDRISILSSLGLPSVPSGREIWMYEDKRRTAYWLEAKQLPHPRTWIFYEREEAERFASACQLPIVFKLPFSAAGTGVRILRSRFALKAVVRKALGRGFVAAGYDRRDRQWGSVLLQEYLPEAREWRLVRIGASYFGHPKGRRGDLHSGSGRVEWTPPEVRHLDLLHSVTEAGGFRYMDVDVLETPDGRLYVNELQAVFGASTSVDQLRRDGVPGRMLRVSDGRWEFEAGDYARNACANARIRDVLDRWPRPDGADLEVPSWPSDGRR
jgi:glutathione synthase/RimK-type ligase-like ATP-grasp enzyme